MKKGESTVRQKAVKTMAYRERGLGSKEKKLRQMGEEAGTSEEKESEI